MTLNLMWWLSVECIVDAVITYQSVPFMTDPNREDKPTEAKVYTYQDLIKFSNTNIYSGFGEVRDSTKTSAPHFSFGTGTRDVGPKKYVNKEMANLDCFGKDTKKGPNYNVTDAFSYDKAPAWKIGTNPRNTLDTKAKYEHYFRKDIDVSQDLPSSTSMKPIEQRGTLSEILASVGIVG